MTKHAPTFVSLFSGCGGLDLGFVDAGYRCVTAVDLNEDAVAVHRENISAPVVIADLGKGYKAKSDWQDIDVVLAGPPCQGFSTIGKRRLDDPRNALILAAARIAVQIRPKVVLMENVSGVLAGKHRAFWEKMLGTLRRAGYKICQLICEGTQFGVPQIRKRVVAIAWRTSYSGTVTLPTSPGGTLRDALIGIKDSPNHRPNRLIAGSSPRMIANHILPGQKLCNVRLSERSVHTWDIPEVYGRTNKRERRILVALARRRRQKRLRNYGDADPVTAQALRWFVGQPVASILQRLIVKGYVRRVGNAYDLSHTFNGKFRRLVWDEPAPTVDTKYGDPYYFLHPEEPRAFTVREAARIQGFPDSFVFTGSERNHFQMIGNAVPPPLARIVGKYIRTHLLND